MKFVGHIFTDRYKNLILDEGSFEIAFNNFVEGYQNLKNKHGYYTWGFYCEDDKNISDLMINMPYVESEYDRPVWCTHHITRLNLLKNYQGGNGIGFDWDVKYNSYNSDGSLLNKFDPKKHDGVKISPLIIGDYNKKTKMLKVIKIITFNITGLRCIENDKYEDWKD